MSNSWSTGIQEETTILALVLCRKYRTSALPDAAGEHKRPVTVTQGTNTIVGSDPQRIVAEALAVLDGKGKAGRVPELWDGHAAERIVKTLCTGRAIMKDKDLLERITVDPKVMVGKPVIRGTRIPVALILKMLGQGIPVEEILREYPRLEEVDIHAAMAYAARVVEHEEVFPLLSWGELVPA